MNAAQFNKLPQEEKQAILNNTRLISSVFNTEAGVKLLEQWQGKYVNKTLPVTATEAEHREANAKRGFVMEIKQALELNKLIKINQE